MEPMTTTHQLHPRRRKGSALMTQVPTPHGSAQLEHVECHSLGHQWRHTGMIGIDDQGDFKRPFGASTGMIGYRSMCSNCKTTRIKWITRSGEVVNRYDYAEGYQRKGDDVLSKREWRQTFAVTLFDSFTHSAPVAERSAS